MNTKGLTVMPPTMGEKFYRWVNKDGDCIGVMKCSPMPIQEFFFIDPEPYEELNGNMTEVVRRIHPLDGAKQVDSTRAECETLLEFHRAAGEVWLR